MKHEEYLSSKMAERAKTICRQPGCGVTGHGEFCPKHVNNNNRIEYERARQNDAVNRLYDRAAWRKFTQAIRARNPLCQRIVDRVQCQNAGTEAHHLVSPRVDISRFLDPQNVVCLCTEHHDNREGTPEWVSGVDYVPTEFNFSI